MNTGWYVAATKRDKRDGDYVTFVLGPFYDRGAAGYAMGAAGFPEFFRETYPGSSRDTLEVVSYSADTLPLGRLNDAFKVPPNVVVPTHGLKVT